MHDEPIAFPWMAGGGRMTTDQNKCGTLVKNQTQAVAHSLRADGFDASEDGTVRGTPLVAVGVDTYNGQITGEVAATVNAGISKQNSAGPQVMAFQEAQTGCREYPEAGCLRANGPGHDPVGTRIRQGLAVRRLTPRECERLQGFPDCWTLIPWRKATAENCPDGPRYKALGNSMAVPVMKWIGQRIANLEEAT